MWQEQKTPEAAGRIENLKELVRAVAEFETLGGFLEHVALVMDNDNEPDDDKVMLMTLHAAKGLEFDTVFLPGWEEGVFPNQRSLDEGGGRALEEERRLAYVGITRAKQRAIISHCANRRIYANWQSSVPSRFIEELPEDAIRTGGSASLEQSNAPPVFASARPLVAARRASGEHADAWAATPRPPRTDRITEGTRVFHQKFGYGVVIDAEDDRLDIRFDNAGEKRVLDRFVERA